MARPPPAWLRGGILHLAAGVVFAVVAVELIPDLLRDHKPIETVVGFTLGVGAMLGLRAWTEMREKRDDARRDEDGGQGAAPALPAGMLAGVSIDLGVDGLMMGVGFAAGAKEGRMLAVALSVELVSLGLAVASSMAKLSIKRTRSVKVLLLLPMPFVLGAGLGLLLLGNLPIHWLAGVLSFGAAALLFLVTEELLTEAHEEKESPLLTAMFFVGFLLFLILEMMS